MREEQARRASGTDRRSLSSGRMRPSFGHTPQDRELRRRRDSGGLLSPRPSFGTPLFAEDRSQTSMGGRPFTPSVEEQLRQARDEIAALRSGQRRPDFRAASPALTSTTTAVITTMTGTTTTTANTNSTNVC